MKNTNKYDTNSYFDCSFLTTYLQNGGDPLTAQEEIYSDLDLPDKEEIRKYFCLSARNFSNLITKVTEKQQANDFLNQNQFFSTILYVDKFKLEHKKNRADFDVDNYDDPKNLIYIFCEEDMKNLMEKVTDYLIDATHSLLKCRMFYIYIYFISNLLFYRLSKYW